MREAYSRASNSFSALGVLPPERQTEQRPRRATASSIMRRDSSAIAGVIKSALAKTRASRITIRSSPRRENRRPGGRPLAAPRCQPHRDKRADDFLPAECRAARNLPPNRHARRAWDRREERRAAASHKLPAAEQRH